jgi:hypothetical protein
MSKVTLKKQIKNKGKVSTEIHMEKTVMEKIKKDQIKMKPKWLFVMGYLLTLVGTVGLTFGAIFLTNLTIFLIKKNGPGYGKLNLMLNSFPLYIPVLAVIGMFLGIWMLKKYDFSYKKNFVWIVFLFVVSIVLAGFLVDNLGLNDIWSHQGPMRRFYQRLNTSENVVPTGPRGRGMQK